MNYKTGLFSMLSLVCMASAAHAAPPNFLWHNKNGFVSASSCQITSLKSVPFYISQGKKSSALESTDLQTPSGARKFYLLNRSLVREATGGKTRKGFKLVDVIGVSQTPKAQTNKWFADRMENGYIAETSLKNLEDYVLEIKSGVSVKEIPEIKIPTVGTFWQLSTEKEEIQGFRCSIEGKSTEFMIFDVFNADSENPIARVGVNSDHTGIFKSILTHLPSEADKVLDSRMEKAPADSRQSLETATSVAAPAAPISPLEITKAAAEEIDSQKQKNEALQNTSLTDTSGTKTESNPATTSLENQGAQAAVDAAPVQDQTINADEEATDESLKLINSRQEHVVCINEDTLNVRDESLEKVLFKAERNESVLPFQSWDSSDTKKKVIGGKEYTFVKIQFPEKEGENVGWLAQDYVRLEGQCPIAKKAEMETGGMSKATGPIKDINSPACCGFPTIKRPSHSYLSGMRRFKAGRSKGKRLHAACDLYRVHGEAAVSIAEGRVVRGLHAFYQGTYALEVQYPGGFIARYGELTGKVARNAATGSKVTRGQVVGHIGTVNSGCCLPMLHFELYSGTKKGGLSVKVTKGNRFGRRTDLMDPTKHLLKWEKNQFGTSY